MTGLYPFFAIACALVVLTNAQQRHELSSYVTNKQLGQINPVTEKKVLNAFVRANPNLPPELRDTTLQGKIYVSVLYHDNRAIIGVKCDPVYSGDVEVYFNGGRPHTDSVSPSHYDGKFNLARRTDLNTNLGLQKGGARVTDDARGHARIIAAFMDLNPQLPTGLRNALRVGRIANNRACLYVPQPNFDYEGNVNVAL